MPTFTKARAGALMLMAALALPPFAGCDPDSVPTGPEPAVPGVTRHPSPRAPREPPGIGVVPTPRRRQSWGITFPKAKPDL